MASGAAFAQNTASSITPGSLAPASQRLNGSIAFTGQAGTQAPAGSEQIGITLSGVDLEDALPQLAAENDAFMAQLTRGRIPVSELFEATAALEASYAEAGLVLSRIILPQQNLRDGGRLKVTVLNGFVEQIDTTNVPENVRARIEVLTASLKDKPGLTRAELERQLLLASDVPGTVLRSALTPGKAQGAAVITLEADFRPVTGFVGFNNGASDALGRFNLSTGVEFNNPLKFGETFYLRFSGAPQKLVGSAPRSRVLAGGLTVPLGFSGLNLNVEATSSNTTPDTPIAPTRSFYDRQSIRLLYPFIRSRQINFSGQVSLDLQEDTQELLTGGVVVPLFKDKMTVLRFGGNITYTHKNNAVTDGRFVLARGLDTLGARTAKEAAASGLQLSRAGSDASFAKLTGSVSHRRALTDELALSVSGRFQTSFGNALVNSEQFSIVGGQEISTFDSGSLSGDGGWVVRPELSTKVRTNFGKMPVSLSPYVFIGLGKASLSNPTAIEKRSVIAKAYGVGLDLFSQTDTSFQSSSIRVELGRGERNDDKPNKTRFSISANVQF